MIGVAQIPSCQDVTLYMKPKLSPSVLPDLPLKCKPWLQAVLRCAALICTTQGNRGLMWRDAAVHLYLHICCIAVWDVLPGEQLCNHHGYPFSSLVPCPANVKGTGFCSAQTRLFLSQLTEDGLTFQLQSLIIPSYCLKFHPFTDS